MNDQKNFHHGDLRAALISAALVEIEKTGPARLSLRELAKQADVSPAAPYRHFADKQALFEALVEISNAELHSAYSSIPSSWAPIERLRRANELYLEMAERRPQLYRLLLSNEAWRREGTHHLQLNPSAYELYEAIVGAAMPAADVDAIKVATLASWAAKHGFAMLRTNIRIEGEPNWEQAQEAVLRLFLKIVT